jgi:hypothetical protein
MLLVTVISLMLGMTLSQRFKVFVLLPAILLTLLIALVTASALAMPLEWIVAKATGCAVIGLQIGYLFGLGIRHLAMPVHANRSCEGLTTTRQQLSSNPRKLSTNL